MAQVARDNSSLITARLLKPVLLTVAILFAYWSVIISLARFWWIDENYSHGLLIPFIAGYILWSERAGMASSPKRPSYFLGITAILFGLAALWAGTAGAELFTQRTSLVLLIIGIVVYFWGFRVLRAVAVPILLLLLAIPIPTIIFNKVAFPLQLFASRVAVWTMRLFDIPVLRQGNVIELMPLNSVTTKKLEVVEACSGIRSLMTLFRLAVFFAYFTSPPRQDPELQPGQRKRTTLRSWAFWRAFIIVLSAIPIAIITNAARVSGTGVLAHYYGTEVSDGFFHSFSGWVVYIAAFLLLLAVGWILDRSARIKRSPRVPDHAKAASEAVGSQVDVTRAGSSTTHPGAIEKASSPTMSSIGGEEKS
jgi:exosortase